MPQEGPSIRTLLLRAGLYIILLRTLGDAMFAGSIRLGLIEGKTPEAQAALDADWLLVDGMFALNLTIAIFCALLLFKSDSKLSLKRP
jgi:hypothetical protein